MIIFSLAVVFAVQGAPSAAPSILVGDPVSDEEINPGVDIEPDVVYEVNERVEQAYSWGAGGLGPKPPSQELTEADKRLMAELKARNKLNRRPTPPVPIAPGIDYSSLGPTDPPSQVKIADTSSGNENEEAFSVGGDGDFRFFRNLNGPGGLSNVWPPEPSFGTSGRIVTYCGNTYAMFSTDGGQTWTSVTVNGEFPSSSPAICCDQVMYYDHKHNALIWLMQGARAGANNENFNRVAFAVGLEDIAARNWTWYDLDPQDFGQSTSIWWDFPEMTVSNNAVWFCTRNVGAGDNIVVKCDMDDFLDGGSSTFSYADVRLHMRLFQGATTVMYGASHVDTDTIEVIRWPETGSVDGVNRDVSAWTSGGINAPGPDGNNWPWPGANRINGACGTAGTVYFFWTAAAGGSFPFSYTRVASFSRNDARTYQTSNQIWNSNFAYGFAQGHPNDRWHLGGVLTYGGNTLFPNTGIWIWDDFNDLSNFGSLEVYGAVTGTNGPGQARWGDYFTSRRHSPYGNTWVAAAYTMQGGSGVGSQTPSYHWFGRRRDEPPSTRTIYVDGGVTSAWQEGTAGRPYDSVGEGQFAGEAGDTVSIEAGTYSEARVFDRPVTLEADGGTVVID
jgi:hypothetical protein